MADDFIENDLPDEKGWSVFGYKKPNQQQSDDQSDNHGDWDDIPVGTKILVPHSLQRPVDRDDLVLWDAWGERGKVRAIAERWERLPVLDDNLIRWASQNRDRLPLAFDHLSVLQRRLVTYRFLSGPGIQPPMAMLVDVARECEIPYRLAKKNSKKLLRLQSYAPRPPSISIIDSGRWWLENRGCLNSPA